MFCGRGYFRLASQEPALLKYKEQAWRKKYEHSIEGHCNTVIIPDARCCTWLVYTGKHGGRVWQEPVVVLPKRPVYECCASNDILAWHKAPGPGVAASPAIIAHHKIIIGWDNLRNRFAGIRIALIAGSDVGFLQCNAVNGYCCAVNGNLISRYGNNTLDIILCRLGGATNTMISPRVGG